MLNIKNTTKSTLLTINGLTLLAVAIVLAPGEVASVEENQLAPEYQAILELFSDKIEVTFGDAVKKKAEPEVTTKPTEKEVAATNLEAQVEVAKEVAAKADEKKPK